LAVIYKVNVSFNGTASLEIEADTVEQARLRATEIGIADLARAGHVDILTFKVAARELTPISSLRGGHHTEEGENAPEKPRPSGWYRPG
jgi:hypothetical protein